MQLNLILVDDQNDDLILEKHHIGAVAKKYNLDVNIECFFSITDTIARLAKAPKPSMVITDVRLDSGESGWDIKDACVKKSIVCYLVSGVPAMSATHDAYIIKKRDFRPWIQGILLGWAGRPS